MWLAAPSSAILVLDKATQYFEEILLDGKSSQSILNVVMC